jgi:GNAT superfamily N-acetyltransferase
MTPRIRQASPADLPRIHAVRHGTAENRLEDPTLATDAEVAWYMNEAVFLVSEDEAGVVQGFTCTNHQTGYVWALFVIDGRHRRGHGRALLDAALDRLRALGHRQAHLTTGKDSAAVDFYLSQGWRDMGLTLRGERAFLRAL